MCSNAYKDNTYAKNLCPFYTKECGTNLTAQLNNVNDTATFNGTGLSRG
jgi:hypothetical protein